MVNPKAAFPTVCHFRFKQRIYLHQNNQVSLKCLFTLQCCYSHDRHTGDALVQQGNRTRAVLFVSDSAKFCAAWPWHTSSVRVPTSVLSEPDDVSDLLCARKLDANIVQREESHWNTFQAEEAPALVRGRDPTTGSLSTGSTSAPRRVPTVADCRNTPTVLVNNGRVVLWVTGKRTNGVDPNLKLVT